MIAKQCQNFAERPVAAARNTRLDSPLKFMPLTRQHADVGKVFRFAGMMAGQVAGTEEFDVYGVTHLGDLLALADLQRSQPQFVMPTQQHRIKGSPFWQVTQLQKS